MKRHLIVFYIIVVVMLLAGRFAWQNCAWELLSSVSAAAVIAATLIESWHILRIKPDDGGSITLSGKTLASVRVAILVICVGMLIAGYGDVLGRWAFGCKA